MVSRKHLNILNTSNLEVHGPQKQKTLLGSTPVSKEQVSVVIMGTGSPKLDELAED